MRIEVLVIAVGNIEAEEGLIGRVYEGGVPVIYKFVNEFPSETVRNKLPWLTVISWKYDGISNNGMSLDGDNQRTIALERVVEDCIEKDGVLRHAYSRTGNNLRELVYYIHDQEQFLEMFNQALINHSRYPIEINFYQDDKWEGFQRLLSDFSESANRVVKEEAQS